MVKKADALNLASEARATERKFELMHNHSLLNAKQINTTNPTALESHFNEHFNKKPLPTPDEITGEPKKLTY